MEWYKFLHLARSFMACYVRIKGLNVILKRMKYCLREGRVLFRKNILANDILQRRVLQAWNKLAENATVMKSNCNVAFWKYSKIVKSVKFYKKKVIELGTEIKHWRDIYISKVLRLVTTWNVVSLAHTRNKTGKMAWHQILISFKCCV